MFFAAALLLPGIASAQFILDSGTPPSSGTPDIILNSTGWYAGKFAATAGENITELSAYLAPNSGNGNAFTFAIYADDNGSFLTTRVVNLAGNGLLFNSTAATFSGTGWNSASVNWTVATTGDYWLAVEETATGRNALNLDVPEETSAGTGTVPALAFAYDSNGATGQFSTSSEPPIGLEVTAVPEPSSVALLGAGFLSFFARRRRGHGCGQA